MGYFPSNVRTVEGVGPDGGGDVDLPAMVPLLSDVDYRPGTDTAPGATASVADLDATNLAVTFTVPDTGVVEIELSGLAYAGPSRGVDWLLREGATEVAGSRGRAFYNGHTSGSTFQVRVLHRIKLTGLTPGDTHTYKWAQVESTGQTGGVGTAFGPTYGSASIWVLAGA